MTEYIRRNATIRIHGNCDPDKLKEATEKFMKKVRQKKGGKNHAQ